MPPENRIRSDDGGQLLDHFPPEDLTFDSQPPALVVVEQDSLLSELLFEGSILDQEVLDSVVPSNISSGLKTRWLWAVLRGCFRHQLLLR